ncbi:MAG TPA: hypothetical protein VJ844_03770 [Mucilaginibacter sp.]|nr:hypothetical protein [Mucilaginibacter sp.]
MNITPARLHSKDQLTKWLFAIVLVLSLFSYGGIYPTPDKPQIYHTALQVNLVQVEKKNINYPSSFYQPCATNSFFDKIGRINRLSIRHAELAKIQLLKHSVPCVIAHMSSFLHRKIISAATAGDPAILV